MFISKLTNWLEEVDPYYTQRIILRKGLYLAVWLTLVNWLATPDAFAAYATSAALLCGAYESPLYTTYREKDRYLVLAYLLSGVGCATFYLLFPYKFTLLIYAVAFFLTLFFLADKFFPKFKFSIMQIIMVSAMNMTVEPEANPQIALDIFFCIMLSLMVTFIALKLHTNLYRQVWLRAFKYYVKSLSDELSNLLADTPGDSARQGAAHLNVIRAYRHLQPKERLINIVRATLYMRGIAFAFMHVRITRGNQVFWEQYRRRLDHFVVAIEHKQVCPLLGEDMACDQNQEFANRNLERAIVNWNKVCSLL